MDARFLTDRAAATTILKLISECDRMAFSVAWASRNAVSSSFLRNTRKISHGIIGTHMYQTSPEILRDFIGSAKVRYLLPIGRLFHPKVYLFWIRDTVKAIVGSHNLTASAFEARNIEASVLYAGKASDRMFIDLAKFVERSWSCSHPIDDDDFLFSYELQHRARKKERQALEKFHVAKRRRNGSSQSPLSLSWPSFVKGVRKDRHHSVVGRLAILETAHSLFAERGSLAQMNRDERRAIAGTYGRKESRLDDLDWGWFGTMSGQGDFKNLVNESPRGLSLALDQIPLYGDVSERQYDQFITRFKGAFENKAHKGGVATASRLLALKRPDRFVAVNSANRDKLCRSFGAAPTTLSLDNYWPSIVRPVAMSIWWNHPRPSARLQAQIWDNRAAMLDSHFYDPK